MRGEMHPIEVTYLGMAWIVVTISVVTPMACYLKPTGWIVTEMFSGDAFLCAGSSASLLVVGSLLLAGWYWVRRRSPSTVDP